MRAAECVKLAAMLRITVVAPVAAPYREPLFEALNARADLECQVIYADASQPSWDVPDSFFATAHAYPAVHLASRQLPRPGRTPIMFPSGLETALAASAPDVIVASEYGPTAIRTRIWATHHGVPYLLLTECTPEINALLPPAQLRWHRRFAHLVDGAIAVSSPARRRLLDFGVEDARITVALQSADLSAIRSTPPVRTDDGDRDTLRLISVGRLVPDKNVGVLLRAVTQAAVDLAPRRLALDVVGDGFLRARLEQTAAELGIDAHFHGHRSGAELAQLYARADAFALLSAYEPFGVVVREAAAACLPIIVSDVVGAVGDVAIAGANALVVPPGDVSAAAVAITRVMGDPARRGRMAEESRRIDAATAGSEVAAFAAAVQRAARP
jgi:glycosyltransferase involved in cell wall biosynthesis